MLKIHTLLGHLRTPSVIDALSLEDWWPTMIKDMKSVENSCSICKRYDPQRKSSVHPMHPLPVPAVPCHTWHIDWMQDLPLTQNGNQNLLVAIDSATRFTIAKAYSHRNVDAQLDFMYELMIRRGFGPPKILISDRAASFVNSIEWKKFLEVHKVEARFSTSYHPQTNGKVERMNQLIGRMLSKLCAGDVNRWDRFVDAVCFNLNARCHTVTRYSPYYLMYGFQPRLPGNITPPALYNLQQHSERLAFQSRELELLGHARASAFHRSQQQALQMSSRYNETRKTKAGVFKVGDLVKRKIQRLPGMMIAKLAEKWEGPFEIGAIGVHDAYYIKRNNVFEPHPVNANHLAFWNVPEGEGTVIDSDEAGLSERR